MERQRHFHADLWLSVGIYSSRGTLNRGARSGINTVNTTLNYEQLNQLTDVRKVGNGT